MPSWYIPSFGNVIKKMYSNGLAFAIRKNALSATPKARENTERARIARVREAGFPQASCLCLKKTKKCKESKK
jgi:hypothetical protein